MNPLTRAAGDRRAVPVLAAALVATLASGSVAWTVRHRQLAYCASDEVQYEYTGSGFLGFNSYADVDTRLCLTPRRAAAQFVDVRLRVTVHGDVSRDEVVFLLNGTWADVTITVDDKVTTQRCDFPELSRMTPYRLHEGLIGEDRALVERCRIPVPPGNRVTVRMTFHGEEYNGPHKPDSRPLIATRDGRKTTCSVDDSKRRCARTDF